MTRYVRIYGIVTVAKISALLIQVPGRVAGVWVPRSQVRLYGDGQIEIPEWLAKEKDLR